MAYSGSTAATSVANPPRRMIDPIISMHGTSEMTATPSAPNGQGGGLWFYATTDTTDIAAAAGFFTDAQSLGMRPGDAMIMVTSVSSSAKANLGVVLTVTSTGATMSLTT